MRRILSFNYHESIYKDVGVIEHLADQIVLINSYYQQSSHIYTRVISVRSLVIVVPMGYTVLTSCNSRDGEPLKLR